jgi:hypothetical protein
LNPSTPESSVKVELKPGLNKASLLDRALFIGGKCQIFNGSGKSPGLNPVRLPPTEAVQLVAPGAQEY